MPNKKIFFTGIIALLFPIACSDRTTAKDDGEAGGNCYPNKTCNTGLVCLASGICAKISADGMVTSMDGVINNPDGVITKLDRSTTIINDSRWQSDTVSSHSDARSGDGKSDDKFSFFVISLERIQKWGGAEGLGGNLGGLQGADAKCQEAAEAVGSKKTWRAFLSVTDDGTGKPVNAIDRIGSGPWYNVNGLLVAKDINGLLNLRPNGATDIVYNDGWKDWPFNQCLTTELGNCNLSYGDTHDTLTGSNREGKLYSTDPKYTCNNWTSTNVNVKLPIGHSWPRRLNGTNADEAHWIYAHTVNGCGANINITNTMESGVGGDGGYGAWYCFAID